MLDQHPQYHIALVALYTGAARLSLHVSTVRDSKSRVSTFMYLLPKACLITLSAFHGCTLFTSGATRSNPVALPLFIEGVACRKCAMSNRGVRHLFERLCSKKTLEPPGPDPDEPVDLELDGQTTRYCGKRRCVTAMTVIINAFSFSG